MSEEPKELTSNKGIANRLVNRIWMDCLTNVTGVHRDAFEKALNEAEERGAARFEKMGQVIGGCEGAGCDEYYGAYCKVERLCNVCLDKAAKGAVE